MPTVSKLAASAAGVVVVFIQHLATDIRTHAKVTEVSYSQPCLTKLPPARICLQVYKYIFIRIYLIILRSLLFPIIIGQSTRKLMAL
jgi:hypothetical protein